jgi:hypothetical protein
MLSLVAILTKLKTGRLKLNGEVRLVSTTGTITGWGYDPDSPMNQICHQGLPGWRPNACGTLIAEGTANLVGYDNDLPGDHAFQLTIPLDYIDNQAHELFVYGLIGGEDKLLKGSPLCLHGLSQGRWRSCLSMPTMSVGGLNACTGCHTFNYDTHWSTLVTPSPAAGGTATNNALINKLSGATNHAGGVFCAGGNGGPCNQIRNWWQFEFGSN